MNFRKGFFRVFLVIASLWFIIVTMFWYNNYSDFWPTISLAIGVPAIIYILGKWITDGFFNK